MLESFIPFIKQLLSPLFYIFCVFAISNSISIYIQFSRSNHLFKYWNKKLLILNEESDEMSDEELEIVKKDAIAYPFISEMINRLSEISKKSEGLNLVEIHEIIDPSINRPVSRLNQGASSFIILGLFFTVAGLLGGLFNLKEFNAQTIKLLLSNLQVAFSTTIIGIILASIPKLGQFRIEKLSENYRYQFTLFARNKLIPHYAIRKADKDLGEVVRQIERSSTELKKAAESVLQLAQNTELSTSRVENAVQGFADVTEKMKQREDDLIKSLSQISSNLSTSQANIESVFIPMIDQLKQDLLNRDINIESNFKTLTNIQDSQSKLNINIDKAMSELIDTNKQIGKFFNEKFEDSFKASMDQLNETYAKKIEKLVSDLKSLSDTIDINTKDNELKQNNHYNNVKTMLESLLIEIKEKIDSYKFPSEEIINELTNLKNDVNNTNDQHKSHFEDLKTISGQITEKIELANSTIHKVSTEVNLLKKENIEKISNNLLKVHAQINEIEKQFKEIKKISKSKSKSKNILSGFFGSSK